jgi:enterochelin esterase-like enzyme
VGQRREPRAGLGRLRLARRRPYSRPDVSHDPDRGGPGKAGLSEGGYGAIIALHHPHEFGLVESWSGYEKAELVPENSPSVYLPHVARALRRAGTYFWFYSGTDDPLRRQNRAFANELSRARLPHRFQVLPGGHNWALWRGNVQSALLAVGRRLAHG